MKIAAGAALVAALLLFLYLRPHGTGNTGPQSMAGRHEVNYTVQDTRGRSVSLSDERGNVVVLNFWASWCPPCRAEMPDLQRVYAQDRSRGVIVIGVDEGESAQHAADFAKSLRIEYPIWTDNDQQYGREYASLGLPATVIIDRNGNIVRGFDGPLTGTELAQTLAPMIAQ